MQDLRKREMTFAKPGTEPPSSMKPNHDEPIKCRKMKQLLGFDRSDISSFSALVSLLYSPKDPSSLGILRIGFGRYRILNVK